MNGAARAAPIQFVQQTLWGGYGADIVILADTDCASAELQHWTC
jgi:hypothetical protein